MKESLSGLLKVNQKDDMMKKLILLLTTLCLFSFNSFGQIGISKDSLLIKLNRLNYRILEVKPSYVKVKVDRGIEAIYTYDQSGICYALYISGKTDTPQKLDRWIMKNGFKQKPLKDKVVYFNGNQVATLKVVDAEYYLEITCLNN
jgi:hypothetical protein